MNILMLTPYLPYPLFSGGQIRTYNLLKNLSKKHQITLFALIKHENERQYISELEKYCKKVMVFKRSEKPFTLKNVLRAIFSLYPFLVIRNYVDEVVKGVKKELQEYQYDAIHAETFYMMPNIPKTTIPVLLVEQTIEYLGYLSYARTSKLWFLKPFLYIDIFKIRKWEEYFWKACTRLIAMSEDDRGFMKQTVHELREVDVVENGVDVSFFQHTKKHISTSPTVLFVGTFKWLPNIEAVLYLITRLWPKIQAEIPDVKLHIVGNSPTKKILALAKSSKGIIISGAIQDIREAYAGAHVLVAPVFSGKGTRYKVLEAMATGTPVVGTTLALEGLQIKPGIHALIGNTVDELAQHTIQVLRDQELREKLAHKGKEFVFTHYNWKDIAIKLDRIYKKVAST